MTLDQCEIVLAQVSPCTEVGDRIISERIFFKCREFDGPRQDQKGRRSVFHGKMRRGARCLDAAAAQEEGSPTALSAQVIVYRCESRPRPQLYQFSGRHKGLRGFLKGNAFCVIERAFQVRVRS